jgi:flagellar basal-body rod protein FlgC
VTVYGSLDIAVSGMIAQRTRMEVITANIVNQDAILDSRGQVNPYRRREIYFAPGDPSSRTAAGRALGVHVAGIGLDPTPAQPKTYDPTHPYAYKDGPYKGYVPTTNVNPIVERINFMEAQRAYEASEVAAETTKTMMAQALRLLA